MKPASLLPLALLALLGCGNARPALLALGKAHLSAPVVGARVEVWDERGAVVARADAPTRANGAFTLRVPAHLAGRFRVAVTGGTHAGAPFGDTLLLDVEGEEGTAGRIPLLYVNAATTMIARHRDRHPGTPLTDAAARVKAFLGIPRTSDPGFDVDNPYQAYFGHEVLLSEAGRAGAAAVGDYLRVLLDELDGGAGRHAFARAAVELPDGVFKVAEELLEGIGENIFSSIFDLILTKAGIGGDAAVLKQIQMINARLDRLTALLDKTLSELKLAEQEVLTAKLFPSVETIKNVQKDVTLLVQHDDPAARSRVASDLPVVLDYNTGVIHDLDLIRTVLAESPADGGLLRRAHDALKAEKPFYPPMPYPELVGLKDYYQAMQLMAVRLIADAYMAQRTADGRPAPDRASAIFYLQQLKADVMAEDALVASLRGEPDVVEDQRNELVWMQAPISRVTPPQLGGWGDRLRSICEPFHTAKLGGYRHWRLPTEEELHKVIKPYAGTGAANTKPGIQAWLVSQGFAAIPEGHGADANVRGFAIGETIAYFSSTASGSYSFEALWDDGVDYACIFPNPADCSNTGNHAPNVGAWCVTERE